MDNVSFNFTKNKEEIAEYCEARRLVFLNGGKKFKGTLGQGKIDEFDDPSNENTHIMIVRRKGVCIGGVRLVTRYPGSEIILPSETKSFQMTNILPEYNLDKKMYGEISRIALFPNNGDVLPEMYYHIRKKAIELDMQLAISTSTKSRAIIFKRVASRTPSKVVIREDVKVDDNGTYDGIDMILALYDFTDECKYGLDYNRNESFVEKAI